jgi:hypothetical protein
MVCISSPFLATTKALCNELYVLLLCLGVYCILSKRGYVKFLSSFLMCTNLASIIDPSVNSLSFYFIFQNQIFNLIELPTIKIIQNSISLTP